MNCHVEENNMWDLRIYLLLSTVELIAQSVCKGKCLIKQYSMKTCVNGCMDPRIQHAPSSPSRKDSVRPTG
jgi:hypothetical protein